MADIMLDTMALGHDSGGMNHAAVIEHLGGASKVSAALDIKSPNTVTWWKRRGIPPLYWQDVARLSVGTTHVLTVDDLRATSERRRVAA